MDPIKCNGAEKQKPTLLERIDKLDVSDSNKLSQELSGISTEVNNQIKKVFSEAGDGGVRVTKEESSKLDLLKSYLCCLNYKLRSATQKVSEDVQITYQNLTQNVTNLIDRVTYAVNGGNPDATAQCEPDDTDAQQSQYAYLDKKADEIIKKSIKEHRARVNSAKVHAHNPYYVDEKFHLSIKTTQEIQDLYMSTVSIDGKRNRGFYDVAKINQFISWADSQLSLNNIDRDDYSNLTKDAKAAINRLTQNNNYHSAKADNTGETGSAYESNFWQEYGNAMHSEGHSHDGVADLIALGYSAEEAQALLNNKGSTRNNTRTITRRPN